LCLGFSGLSLVELLYFFTLRAWCYRRKQSEKYTIKKRQDSLHGTQNSVSAEIVKGPGVSVIGPSSNNFLLRRQGAIRGRKSPAIVKDSDPLKAMTTAVDKHPRLIKEKQYCPPQRRIKAATEMPRVSIEDENAIFVVEL